MAIKFGRTSAAKTKPAPKPSTAKRKTPIPPRTRSPTTKPKAWEKAVARKKKVVAVKPEPESPLAMLDENDAAVENLHTFAEFKEAGFAYLRRTVDGVFYFSSLLWNAKKRLSLDEFKKLVSDLDIADSSAAQYMKIARSGRLRKLKDQGKLPRTAHVIYLLASMEDDEFKAFTKQHDVTPHLETREIREFRTAWKDKDAIAHLPKTTRQAAGEAAREFAEAATAPVGDGDEGAFQAPQETGEPSGSPNLSQPSMAVLTTARELGEGILAITADDLVNAVNDLPTATDTLAFVTKLVEHVELMRTKLADREFDLQDEAAA